MSITFGGYVIASDGGRNQLEIVVDPDESDIRNVLVLISRASGVVTMRCTPGSEGSPDKLTLYVEAGNFLPMLGEYDSDGEYNVRTLNDISVKNELMVVLGEKYPARAVTRDINLVFSILLGFSRTGNVSSDLMT